MTEKPLHASTLTDSRTKRSKRRSTWTHSIFGNSSRSLGLRISTEPDSGAEENCYVVVNAGARCARLFAAAERIAITKSISDWIRSWHSRQISKCSSSGPDSVPGILCVAYRSRASSLMCSTDAVPFSLHRARWHPIVGRFRNFRQTMALSSTEWHLSIGRCCKNWHIPSPAPPKLTHSHPWSRRKVGTPCARAVIAVSAPHGGHHTRPLAAHCLLEI